MRFVSGAGDGATATEWGVNSRPKAGRASLGATHNSALSMPENTRCHLRRGSLAVSSPDVRPHNVPPRLALILPGMDPQGWAKASTCGPRDRGAS